MEITINVLVAHTEALGHWLSEELGNNQQRIEELLRIIQQLEQQRLNSHEQFGKKYNRYINQDEVKIFSLALDGTVDDECLKILSSTMMNFLPRVACRILNMRY